MRAALGDGPEAVLIIWQALGVLAGESGPIRMRNNKQPLNALLEFLAHAEPATQQAAIEQIRRSKDPAKRAGAGAFLLVLRSWVKTWATPVDGQLLASLAKDVYPLARDALDESAVAEGLLEWAGPSGLEAVSHRLMQLPDIDFGGLGRPDPKSDRTARIVALIVSLAKQDNPAALPVLAQLAARCPKGPERLALEVGIATLDPSRSASVGLPHLRCESNSVQMAAIQVIEREGRTLPLEALVELARPPFISDEGVAEDEFDDPRSVKAWARGQLAALGVAALPIRRTTVPSISASEAEDLLNAGRYEEAHTRFCQLTHEPNDPLPSLKAMLGSGRLGDAALSCQMLVTEIATYGRNGSNLSDALVLRGATHFANGWYESAAADFVAAIRLNHQETNWLIVMQYLALAHLGRENEAMLHHRPSLDEDEGRPNFRWPYLAKRFLEGKINEAELLDATGANRATTYPSDIKRLAQAHWLLAENARLANQLATEHLHLDEVLAQGNRSDEIHLLAHLRRRELRWANKHDSRSSN